MKNSIHAAGAQPKSLTWDELHPSNYRYFPSDEVDELKEIQITSNTGKRKNGKKNNSCTEEKKK